MDVQLLYQRALELLQLIIYTEIVRYRVHHHDSLHGDSCFDLSLPKRALLQLRDVRTRDHMFFGWIVYL